MAPSTTIVAKSRDKIHSYFDDLTFSDLTIKLSDRVVHLHRVVLCRGSEYFRSLLAGKFKESKSKQIELHEDDPEAMMVLLRYLYALPYLAIQPKDVKKSCLHLHTLVYVAAEKYQVFSLRKEAYENIKTIAGPTGVNNYDFADFTVTLRAIFTATAPDSPVRVLIMQACIAKLQKLNEDPSFVSLVLEVPDLAVAIIKHTDLTGDWLCVDEHKCSGLPACSKCAKGKLGIVYPFDQALIEKYRNLEMWPCPACKSIATPTCSDCGGAIKWSSRRPTRESRYER